MSNLKNGALEVSIGNGFKLTYPTKKRFQIVLETFKNPLGIRLWWVFCFQLYSDDFTESHRFVGTFVGIWVPVKCRYQQLIKIVCDWPSSSWYSSNKQYNLKSICRTPFEALRESAFVVVNKWRKFRVSLSACRALEQNNSFSRSRLKTIHPVVNPKVHIRANCHQQAAARSFISILK